MSSLSLFLMTATLGSSQFTIIQSESDMHWLDFQSSHVAKTLPSHSHVFILTVPLPRGLLLECWHVVNLGSQVPNQSGGTESRAVQMNRKNSSPPVSSARAPELKLRTAHGS